MTIKYTIGDATKPQGDGLKLIVHCCNDLGAWGAGFVMALSARWPGPEEDYHYWHSLNKEWFKKETLPLGRVQFVKVEPDIFVCNLIGQKGLIGRDNPTPVRYDAIENGLKIICDTFKKEKNVSLHMPKMGAGLAGGDWKTIEKIVEKVCSSYNVTVYELPSMKRT